METIITRAELKKIYDVACQTWKSKIEKYAQRNPFGEYIEFTEKEIQEMISACTKEQLPIVKEIFNITTSWENIKSLSDAIKYLGESDEDVVELSKLQKAECNTDFQELVVIIKSINENRELDWDNSNITKYYIWFDMRGEGSYYGWGYYWTPSAVPARLCFTSIDKVEHFIKYFEENYRRYMKK